MTVTAPPISQSNAPSTKRGRPLSVDPFDTTFAHISVAMAGLAFGISYRDVFQKSRTDSQSVFIRQLAMYLMVTMRDMNATHVGRVFGRDRTTVSYACGVIESQRDDPVFEAKLLAIEDIFAAVQSSFSSGETL